MNAKETQVIKSVLSDLQELMIEYVESHGILYTDELLNSCFDKLNDLISE